MTIDEKWEEITQTELEFGLHDNFLNAQIRFKESSTEFNFQLMTQHRVRYLDYLRERDNSEDIEIGKCYRFENCYMWEKS